MKRLFLILPLLILSFLVQAQKTGSISGTLRDSVNRKEILSYATVSVYKAADSALVSYKLSDDKGMFRIANLPLDVRLRVVINAYRYAVLRREFTLTAENANLALDTLLFNLQKNQLNEITITAERPPIIVRKDTIEFNAESFKTLPTAVVEDLLKKLPGVAIASDGSIQVNGKSVSKILVDGKEFFGGDQQIATKNLPANIIDKIQVSDDKEAKRRDPDLIAANTPQVINLKLKKAIKQGAFGKLYGGGGLHDYFETGGIMNIFRDTTQVSVLAYGNNVNKSGFSIGDIQRLGGFSRSGVNSIWINSEGGFGLDNISFGGTGSGTQTSSGGGFNFNTLTKKGIKLNGKYFFGQSNNLTQQLTNENQTLNETERLITNNRSDQRAKSYTHNIGGKMEWKIDSLTTLTVNPTVTLNTARTNRLQTKTSSDGLLTPLNTSENNSNQKSDNNEYYVSADLWKDFKKAGRSVNFSGSATKRNNLNDNFNYSSKTIYTGPPPTTVDQLRDNNMSIISGYLSANYSEPINKVLTFSASVSGNYIDNENALSTFYKNPSNQAYDVAVPTLSEIVTQTGFKTSARTRIRWKVNKDLAIRPGVVFNTIHLKNRFTHYPGFNQDYQFAAPTLNVVYKSLSLDYTPSFTEPDVQYVQPVANNTDLLFIQNGNPLLLPAKTHRVNLNLYKYDAKRSFNYNIYANGSVRNNAVVMSRSISATGEQVSTPVNANGVAQFYSGVSVTRDFKKDKRQISLSTGFYSNYIRNIILVNGNKGHSNSLQFTPQGSVRINLNDKLELNQSYNVTINNSTYDNSFYTDLHYVTQSSESELIVRFPKKFVWETIYRVQLNSQQVAGYNNTIKIWNAGLTYLFMKNDRAQLKFSVNDLLNTNVRRYLYLSDNSVRDVQTNNLGRYGLLTLTYNIQNFGGKVGGKETFFRF